jgi:hypothetical protein
MIYFILCILAVYFDVFANVNAFTGGMNYHLWHSLMLLMHFLMFIPVMKLGIKIKNYMGTQLLYYELIIIYLLKLLFIYILIRFFIFDYAYGFFSHGNWDYLGNSLYDTIIGAFPVWSIAIVKSIGFIFSGYLTYLTFKK